MLRSDESDTAEPQKESFRTVSWGQPRARTSVAVSERAQQKDWSEGVSLGGNDRIQEWRIHVPDQAPAAPWRRQ